MTREQIKRNRQAMRALRRNKKKAKGKMRDKEGGRCCLCVIFDEACKMGYKPPATWKGKLNYPPRGLSKFMGWGSVLTEDPLLNGIPASWHNDGSITKEKSHKEIADLFEENFPEIKTLPRK